MIQFYVKHDEHILLIGPTGTSKTITVKDALSRFFLNEKYANMQISFSGQTKANDVQENIESRVNQRRKKGHWGPEDRKDHMVCFIDDVNMPALEQYGAQPPIELLRQWMDYGGWYDLVTKEMRF